MGSHLRTRLRTWPRRGTSCRTFALGAIGLVVTCLSVVAAPAEIAPDPLLQHIKFLSSDELRDEATAPRSLKRQATTSRNSSKTVGLQPGGTSNEWFQPFQLIAGLTIGSATNCR